MILTRQDTRKDSVARRPWRRVLAALAMSAAALGAVQYAPAAMAAHGHGGGGGGHWSGGGGHWGGGGPHWHGGYWRGGVFIGPGYDPFWYGAGFYGPGYYAPYYAPDGAYGPPPPDAYAQAPAGTLPPPPALTPEQRAQRLNQMCAQGVFTPEDCTNRRAELLNEM